jgi:signal transduction histidine kinase
VLCSIARVDGASVLTLEDDGPGCSSAELQAIGGRGVRLDESVSGHGLGLSIVRDIVDLYGGSVSYGRSKTLDGFLACVSLPVNASPSD